MQLLSLWGHHLVVGRCSVISRLLVLLATVPPLEDDVGDESHHDRSQDGAVDGDEVLVEAPSEETRGPRAGRGGLPRQRAFRSVREEEVCGEQGRGCLRHGVECRK